MRLILANDELRPRLSASPAAAGTPAPAEARRVKASKPSKPSKPATARSARGSGRSGSRPGRPGGKRARAPSRLWLAAVALTLVVAAGGAAWRAWADGVEAFALRISAGAVVAFTDAAGLRVVDAFVVGHRRTDIKDIKAALGIATGVPILGVDLQAARERIEALGWVRSAAVARRLPGTIDVRIEERTPMALWQNDGAITVIDGDGRIVPEADPAEFAMLPLLVDDGAPQAAAELFALLDAVPLIAARVKAAVRVSGRRWDLHMMNDIVVQLPAEDAANALQRLAEAERSHALLDRSVISIDMRDPERVIINVGRAHAETEPGEPT